MTSPAYQQQVRDWLRANCPHLARCPLCGHRQWDVGNLVTAPSGLAGAVPASGTLPRGMPLVPVVCARCAFVLLFAWEAMNLTVTPAVPVRP